MTFDEETTLRQLQWLLKRQRQRIQERCVRELEANPNRLSEILDEKK